MDMKKVKALLKENGYRVTTTKRLGNVTVRQEENFLRISLQNPAFTLQDDGEARGGSVEIPTGHPTKKDIEDLLTNSALEKTQVVQIDFEIGDGQFSSYWRKPRYDIQ
jgi:hypothetical protein